MPEWNENNQDVEGNENTLIQNVRSSNINITNNYGMSAPPPPIDEFSKKLKECHPPKKTPLHEKIRVNCDRKEQLRKMRNHNSNSNQHLFYFILACPNELPEKLIQNFVFELINDNSYSDDNPILFKISSDFNGTKSIDIQSLSELNINSIQRKWLEPLKNRDYIFENFISQELSKQKLEYLVSAFKISIELLCYVNQQVIE